MKLNRTVLCGTATLRVDVGPLSGSGSLLEVLFAALYRAHDDIVSVRVGYDGVAEVEVVIPADGRTDFAALESDLRRRAVTAIRKHEGARVI